jgi:hypothetical protein
MMPASPRKQTSDATHREEYDTSPPNGMLSVNAACVHVYQSQHPSNQKLG